MATPRACPTVIAVRAFFAKNSASILPPTVPSSVDLYFMILFSPLERGCKCFGEVSICIHILHIIQVFKLFYQAYELVCYLLIIYFDPGLWQHGTFRLHHFVLPGL